ncbi:PREDICTED: uncharacterized protein LOC107068754 [Polistes dominula]|uniref:Uncharacterized protein LOC107068754 n=1 Tax=Polistes dominula TaxID=743375 RepID=A0ABM1IL67_POLDO|nr:PREDICTED: uncharacterized protein LOC107068754 [Polistes dominula]
MEAIWNKIYIERPPNITWRIKAQKFDIKGLNATLQRIIKDLGAQNDLHKEAAILSRVIYRMKCKFRNDKGFKNMEKVNRALLNYLNLALEKEYKNFKSNIELNGTFVTLPSKQMLEYILVKTQGFAKLLARVEEVTKNAGIFLRSRVALGHAWTITLVAYAVISRIWVLSKNLVRKSCIWYNSLHRFLNTFQTVGLPWLSKNDTLPVNLKSWLALPWLDENESSIDEENILKDKMFKLIEFQEDNLNKDLNSDLIETTELISDVSENISKPNVSKNVAELSIHMSDDLGEIVDRSSCAINFKKRKHKETSLKEQKQSVIDQKHESDDTKQMIELKSNFKKQKIMEDKNCSLISNSDIVIDQLEPKVKKKKCKKKKKSTEPYDKTSNENVVFNFDNMTKSDLIRLLQKDHYQGMDKLQWNIIKKQCNKLLKQSNKCTKEKNELLVRKAINIIRGKQFK